MGLYTLIHTKIEKLSIFRKFALRRRKIHPLNGQPYRAEPKKNPYKPILLYIRVILIPISPDNALKASSAPDPSEPPDLLRDKRLDLALKHWYELDNTLSVSKLA